MRLKLDWSLSTLPERQQFLQSYVADWNKSEFTEEELEMMGNYLLWCANHWERDTSIQIESKNSPWKPYKQEESLDALLETPTFNENGIAPVREANYRTPRATFSREKALSEAPPVTQQVLIDLFKRIDTLDLIINFYDLRTGKRVKEPRKELISQFTEEEIETLKEKANNWNQRIYLQNRHLLVELRREQFTIKDTYAPVITRRTPEPARDLTLEQLTDLDVLPLGNFNSLFFLPFRELNPSKFNESDLILINNELWRDRTQADFVIDLQNPDQLYQIFSLYYDLEDDGNGAQSLHKPENSSALIRTINYYIENTNLTPAQSEILKLKFQKTRNEEIARIVNIQYNKQYSVNYISTIYKQKIIPAICATAQHHRLIIENIFFEENFKKCNTCGGTFLKDDYNFAKKGRSKDGYATRCKRCDKADRERKKGGIK